VENATHIMQALFNPRRPPGKPRRSGRQAKETRVRNDLNNEVKTRLQARIPHAWLQSESFPKDRDVLLAALRYLRSLRDRISGIRRVSAPASRIEIWPLARLWDELNAMIPERLQEQGKAQIKAQIKYTGSIHIMVGVELYLDELELAIAGLEEDAVQPSESEDSDEWNGLSDRYEAEEDAGRQQDMAIEEERGEVEEWHELSDSDRIDEDAVRPLEPDEAEDRNSLSERDEPEEDTIPLTELTEDEWNGIAEEIEEQSRNMKAFKEVLACAEERRLYIGNLAPTATGSDLEAFFSGYEVESMTFPLKKGIFRRSFGFLNLKNADEAESAISELSGKELLGRTITIELVNDSLSEAMAVRKEREARAETGRDYRLQDKVEGNLASDSARTISEAQVENALSKIEQWCDLWLSGSIAEDQWHTFEDCLDLERSRYVGPRTYR
jgi:hypothetical protein